MVITAISYRHSCSSSLWLASRQNLDFGVDCDSRVAIVGPNGAGGAWWGMGQVVRPRWWTSVQNLGWLIFMVDTEVLESMKKKWIYILLISWSLWWILLPSTLGIITIQYRGPYKPTSIMEWARDFEHCYRLFVVKMYRYTRRCTDIDH